MKSPFFNFRKLKNEKGQSAITLAMLTITFLTLSGFSLDAANLFLKKTHLKRSLDAGAIAGITRYASGDQTETVSDTAREMALYNLQEMGINPSTSNVAASFTTDSDGVATLSLTGTITIKTLFMRFIPGFATVDIAAQSSAIRNVAIISLVLDTSGSMSCNGGCPATFQALKDAANAFIDSFEDGLDQMAIITFSEGARIIAPMTPVNKSFLHGKINALTSNGWTSTPEGIVLGRTELEKINNDAAVHAMVVFTDGAPNIVRPIFMDGNSAFLPANHPPTAPEHYDYHVYLNTSPPEIHHPTTLAQICTNSRSISQCLNSFQYLDSRNNLGHYSHITSLTSPYTEMKKESYDLAIIESDYAKSDGIVIYTVGLGAESTITNDPYQNVNVDTILKSIFLRRLANDEGSSSDPEFPNLPTNDQHATGNYLQTPNPSDLTSLFTAIAQKIKLRLIE